MKEELLELRHKQREDYENLMQGVACLQDPTSDVPACLADIADCLIQYQEKNEAVFELMAKELEELRRQVDEFEKHVSSEHFVPAIL